LGIRAIGGEGKVLVLSQEELVSTMLQYLVTALAGIVVGIVAMRVWQARSVEAGAADEPAVEAGEAGDAGAGQVSAPLSTRNLLIGAGVLAAGGAAVLLLRSPQDAAAPLPAGSPVSTGAQAQSLDDVDTMIGRLAERLAKNPGDAEGFRMLGWSYVMTGHPEKAIEPYKRALALKPGSALIQSGYGEALVGMAGSKTVTAEAKAAFAKALAIDPSEPRARYFMALWQAQNGQEKAALDQLLALAAAGPADAPWQADVRREAEALGGKLGVDVAKRLPTAAPAASAAIGPPALDSATVQAAGQMPEGQRQAMVDNMVEGLAAKLKANPGNADGWVMLLRSRMVLKQADQATDDLAAARKALAGDAVGLAKVDLAARDLSIPGK